MSIMPPSIKICHTNDNAPSFVPTSSDQRTRELTRLAGHINTAEYRFLKLLAALVERDAWGGNSGMKSPAHWLNYYCGIDLGAAREIVRVAKARQTLPRIDAEFATGALSYSKVRAMTRCATPENEDILLNVARYGTAAHMEKLGPADTRWSISTRRRRSHSQGTGSSDGFPCPGQQDRLKIRGYRRTSRSIRRNIRRRHVSAETCGRPAATGRTLSGPPGSGAGKLVQ